MKISLVYPKISENSNKFLNKCIAFEKYDGTNISFYWNKSAGWHSFGTRRTKFPFIKNGIEEFKKEHYELVNAPQLFNDCFRDTLSIFLAYNSLYKDNNIIIFTEFYGPNSFAGTHSEEDKMNNDQKLVVIDVAVNNKIIAPELFRDNFSPIVSTAKVVYTGKYSGQFAEDIRKGKYPVNEGVVVKGIVDNEVFMTKIKTNYFLKKLQKR